MPPVFGKITNSRRVSIDNLAVNAYSTEFLDDFSVSGFQFNAGLQYILVLDKKSEAQRRNNLFVRRLIIGATASNNANFNTNVSRFYNRDNFGIRLNSVDTLVKVDDLRLSGTLPGSIGFGLTYERTNNFRISAEYSMGAWSKYENEAKQEQLQDNMRAALGVEWIPDVSSYNRYLERVRYRFGAFYGTDPRSVAGTQLENYGVSLGFSLPIEVARQTISFVHIAFEAGRLGAGELLQENYLQASFGFSLNDNTWFYKRKFN